MRRIVAFLQCFALTIGSVAGLSFADCPTWDDLLSEESVLPVRIARRSREGPMYIAYVNPSELGLCILGEEIYNQLSEKLFQKYPDRHFFWIGGAHSLDMKDVASRTSMLQEGQEFYFDLATRLRGPRAFPEIHTEFLVSFDGEIDFSEPVTIFFTGFRGNYSNEYWLPEKYLPPGSQEF